MIIYLVYKSPLWKNLESKSRKLRIFILGTVIYIALHSFINSKFVENNEFIEKNKKYLYYLFGLDMMLSGSIMYFGKSSDKSTDKKLINDTMKLIKPKKINLQKQIQMDQQRENVVVQPNNQPVVKPNMQPPQMKPNMQPPQMKPHVQQQQQQQQQQQVKSNTQMPNKTSNELKVPLYNSKKVDDTKESEIKDIDIPIYVSKGNAVNLIHENEKKDDVSVDSNIDIPVYSH